ncbi:D-TA family PLP-dependent enzyme [Chitinophaga pendula]|uniref:D-TA family PLP-dependent enzyme n=1 Tax=Chitinophaga TaxID=79328 RepID=UPI000BB0A212|nr:MULTISPECIES: D-TA family PLP-dependent enzyme [Chitinophaga]ASZ14737.1 threonine aldolase [Chitinophaga sp. MD30]UCJ07604.1 D-TA family PLP-dependent enzyme [Chitinophaga pendula]
MEWYEISNIDTLDTPALLVYPQRVEENIRLLKTQIDDVRRLRVHVKTNKTAEVVQLLLDAGITKFKCATIAEAEMLGMLNAPDVLLAYQPVGPKVGRLLALADQYTQTSFGCLVDNEGSARAIADAFALAGAPALRVWVDLNIGMNRTGIVPGDAALALYTSLHQLEGIQVAGLHAYDGHLHDADLALRKEKCDAAFGTVAALAEAIREKGLPAPVITAGGSPTFPIHAGRQGVECSPGTFVFWDWGYAQGLPEQPFQYAALLGTRVISVISDTLICVDLGHKSVAAENPQPRVHFLNAPAATPVSQSEEHLVLQVADSRQYPVGTVLYGVPKHICPSVALYDKAHVIVDHVYAEDWVVIARDRSIYL